MDKLNKTRAFLTEFIIVILFFSVAAVITMQLFVVANNHSDDNKRISDAVIHAQTVAENIRAGVKYYGKEGIYSEYLDENMELVDESEAVYIEKVIVSISQEESTAAGDVYDYDIVISDADSDEVWYSLSFKQYQSKEVQ